MKYHQKRIKTRYWRNVWFKPLALSSLAFVLLLSSGTAFAQEQIIRNDQVDIQTLQEYWTTERMGEAISMDMAAEPEPAAVEMAEESLWTEDTIPGYVPGWRPGSGPQPDPQRRFEITPDNPLYPLATGTNGSSLPLTQAPFSPPSSPADFANYAPFSRWTWYGRYLTYPTSTIGRLFFTIPGQGNFVCSASVIGRRTIATAGHCIRDLSGTFTNFMFCPSYNQGGINPATGCWGWEMAVTSQAYANFRATDRDYGCIVTSPTNSTTGRRVGDVTGWTGRTFNWRTKQAITAFGYPAGSPFPGYHIIVSASPEWYEMDMTAGDGQVSKYIGSDMTGGSSGGPWWIGIGHRISGFEYPDVDGSNLTDPLQGGMNYPFINGINSHRRCTAPGCPPGSIFLSEIGSPQFRNTAGDTDESEDVFNICLSQE